MFVLKWTNFDFTLAANVRNATIIAFGNKIAIVVNRHQRHIPISLYFLVHDFDRFFGIPAVYIA